jgi:arylsulfatase A-like enzyme
LRFGRLQSWDSSFPNFPGSSLVNAICLAIDRLHSGFLGCYGNTWIETPAFDRLATESFVFDQMLVDSPRLEPLYRSFWQGWHALAPAADHGYMVPDRPALPALLREAGVHCTLLSDERAVIEHPLAIEFDDCLQIDPPWQTQMVAEGAYEETHLARCFLQIVDWVQTAKRPFFLWCHLGSLGTTWDAPPECRERYWDESDPPLLATADVPDRMLQAGFDPDELLVYTQAYAGQIALLDTCLGGFLEVLEDHPAAHKTLLALTSARGFPMGEHLRLGPCDEALHGELVHVPLFLRFPNGSAAGRLGATARSQALVEPADLWATLLDRWRIAAPPSPTGVSLMPLVREEPGHPVLRVAARDRLVVAGPGAERAIRTPAWYLRKAEQPELYAKPDDLWEVNNVAVRCQEVVDCLLDAADRYEQALYSGNLADLPPLGDVLVEGLG